MQPAPFGSSLGQNMQGKQRMEVRQKLQELPDCADKELEFHPKGLGIMREIQVSLSEWTRVFLKITLADKSGRKINSWRTEVGAGRPASRRLSAVLATDDAKSRWQQVERGQASLST